MGENKDVAAPRGNGTYIPSTLENKASHTCEHKIINADLEQRQGRAGALQQGDDPTDTY